MLKLRSDGSLISQFNSNIQKSVVTVVLHVVFYRVELTLRSKRSIILKCTEACSSTDKFGTRIPVFDCLIFCCGNLILYQKEK